MQHALEPGIIACTAGIWNPTDKYCLPKDTAAAVIRESGSRVLVTHIPNPKNIQLYEIGTVDLSQLISKTSIRTNDMTLFFNTSLCSNVEDILQVFEVMRRFPFYSKVGGSFLKLDILDETNKPSDIRTRDILSRLPQEIRRICLPFISGDLKVLAYATKIGCPGIRIWCSEIGHGQGIKDLQRLSSIVDFATVPLILEGGIGSPEDATLAIEIGYKAVLINSAFRFSDDPIELAREFRNAINSAKSCSRS